MRTLIEIKHDLSKVIHSEKFIEEITPQLKNLAKDLAQAKENTENMQDTNRSR